MTITKCSKCGKRYLIPGFLFHTWVTHKCEKKKLVKKINDIVDKKVDRFTDFFFMKWWGLTILFFIGLLIGVIVVFPLVISL